jgi:anti-sigma factor RsiW
MNDADFSELELEAQRRPLKADEEAALQAHLAAHPEAQADWQADLALNHVLRRLFDAPLSSNFTPQVLQAVEREARRIAHPPIWTVWLRVWSWRWPAQATLTGGVALACLLLYGQYRAAARARLAESVETVYGVASLPSDVLENVDAISQAPPDVDVKLLVALQP